MKIVITNAYTWYNKGDAGILLATIDVLKKIYKDAEFKILSFNPEEDSKRYCKDKTIKGVYSNILNPHPYKHTKPGKIFAIMKLFFKWIITYINIKFNFKKYTLTNETMQVLNEADVIIVCGGGFLGGKKLDSLMHVYQIYIDTLFDKPVYIMGTSIEPMKNKIVKKYTEKVLKKVDHIFAREEITEKYLASFIPKEKYSLIPDMAFMLSDYDLEYDFIDDLRKKFDCIIGITVRDWKFPNLDNPKYAMKNYINAISKAMTILSQKYNACFVFVPQVTVYTGDDTIVAKKIKNILDETDKEIFFIREDDWSPYEIKALIGNFDYFIGTRMHSNIFATSMHIPTTAIAYERKTNGIMKTLEMEKYVVEIDTISAEKLISIVEGMIENNVSIKKHLNEKINEIRKEIYNNTTKVLTKEK